MIQVGASHQGDPLPGHHEHPSTVLGVLQGNGLGDRKPPERKYQVAASEGSDVSTPADPCPQPVGPRPRGIYHHPCGNLGGFPGHGVFHHHPADLLPLHHEFPSSHIVERQGPILSSLLDDPHYQSGIIGNCIPVLVAAFEPYGADAGGEHDKLMGRVIPVIPLSSEKIVHGQEGTQRPPPRSAPSVLAEEKTKGVDQSRGFPNQFVSLPYRVPGQSPVTRHEVAQPAVDHLGGSAGGAPGEISLFHERGPKALPGGLPQYSGTSDSPTDDQQVPPGRPFCSLFRQLRPGPLSPLGNLTDRRFLSHDPRVLPRLTG